MKIASNTVRGTPLYEAGLDRGDQIVRIGRFSVKSPADVEAALARHEPGDSVEVAYVSRTGEGSVSVTLAGDPALKITRKEAGEETLSETEQRFREAWLGVGEAE